MLRRAVYSLAGVMPTAYWLIVRPTHDTDASLSTWPVVILFSGVLAALGAAVLVFGREHLRGRRRVVGAVTSGALFAASAVNVVEDGFHVEAAFIGFVATTALTLVGLLSLTGLLLLRARAGRLWALIPAGTAVGIIGFVEGGAFLVTAVWLVAALRSQPEAPA